MASYFSPSKTFSFEYPENWKLKRNDDGSILLWKKGGLLKKDSEYVLKIVPQVSDSVISPQLYRTFVDFRKKEHADLEEIDKSDFYIMNFHIIKYRKIAETEIQDIWELVLNNRIFTCSFTVARGEEDSPKAKEERATAETILQGIRLL